MAKQCLVVAIGQQSLDKVSTALEEAPLQLTNTEDELRTTLQGLLFKELEKVMIGSDGDKYFQVGVQLPPAEKEELIGFWKGNVDDFSWSAYEALRIDLDFICQHLDVNQMLYQ